MKGIGKRLGTLAMCLLLVCLLTGTVWAAPTENCPGGCTHPAAIGATHYATLAEAVSAAKDADTVTVLADITLPSPLWVEKAITLDLGGKTLTGNLTVMKDAAVCNGTLKAETGIALQVIDCAVTLQEDLIVLGSPDAPAVQLTASAEAEAAAQVDCQITAGEGQSAIVTFADTDGICQLLIGEKAVLTADSVSAITMEGSSKLEITGGTLSSEADPITLIPGEGQTEVTVTGGTFTKAPSKYIPSGYRARKNDDGTYTVVAVHTISFDANGGKGKQSSKKADNGASYQLPKCSFTAPKGKDFHCWQIGSKTYAPGDSICVVEDITVKALWKTHTHTGGKATCESKAVCSVCDQKYGSLADHKLKKVSGYDATCTEAGRLAHQKCSVCGQRFANGVKISASSVSIPALGHDLTAIEGREATCTEAGLLAHEECTYCGRLYADGKKISKKDLTVPASGHTMEAVEAVAASCTQTGVMAHERCTVCNSIFLNGAAAEPSELTTATEPHLLSDWASDEAAHWKACVDCGATFRKHSHKDIDQDGSCDECAYAVPVVEVKPAPPEEEVGFSFAYLIPVAAAAVIAVALAVKKRKQ